MDLGLVGHQLDEQAGQADALRAQLAANELVALGRDVALVEHQVHDGEHGSEPVGQLGVRRDSVGDLGGADLVLRSDQPLGHGRLRDQEGPGDLGGLQPGDEPQRQRHLRVGGERRMAAREDEPELVVHHGTHVFGFVG